VSRSELYKCEYPIFMMMIITIIIIQLYCIVVKEAKAAPCIIE